MVLLLKLIIYPLSFLPLRVLYWKAAVWRVLFQYVIRYRRKVVETNIAQSFPEKSESERRRIVSGFYTYFTELIAEAIKSFTMSEQEAMRRTKILNPEVANKYYGEGKSIVLMFGHFNNWEWPGLGSRQQIKHCVASIYKKVKNKSMNDWIYQNRSRFGNLLMSMEETHDFYDNHPAQPTINAFISDQNPRNPKTAVWVDFLGRETAFLTGAARIGKKHHLPILFADIQQAKKGYYEVTFSVITNTPNDISDEAIISSYASKLEAQIRNYPSRWLWSHKRWKHKKDSVS